MASLRKTFSKVLPCILSKPCKNNGCCKDDNLGGYKCECENGFTGEICETRLYLD